MLTAEENELLTRVGPGTPGGEFFRRYWHPIAMVPELSEETPTKFVRILGEDLVLFRDKSGQVGLLADHCPHRGASLLYGRVEARGIACAYHGWLYDTQGNCLETPAEPTDSLLHLTVKHRAYPVRAHYAMYWAYLGPAPVPLLPRFDVAELGPTTVKRTETFDCNWLQVLENHVDQSHVVILHQDTGNGRDATPVHNTTRGRIDDLAAMDYSEAPFGIKRRQVHRNGYDDTDLIIFPATQRIFNHVAPEVPIDDTHTLRYVIYTELPIDDSSSIEGHGHAFGGPMGYYLEKFAGKTPNNFHHPFAHYRMDKLALQDLTMLETQGAISDRENERLGTADRGVVLLRNLLKREIEKVQQGLDPIGVIRDPNDQLIDTYIDTYLDMVRRGLARLPSRDNGGVRLFADQQPQAQQPVGCD